MARALLGHVGTPNTQALTYEVARLRRRVHELETELAQARALHDSPAEHAEFDLELHRIAESESPVPA